MPRKVSTSTENLQRDTLRRIASNKKYSNVQQELALLRIAYSEDSKLLTGYINTLVNVRRIHPRFAPIQASGRTSTMDPPITNWPRACIEPHCQQRLQLLYGETLGYIEHEWTDECWSVRDILLPDSDEILTVHDHDNIEGRIHDLIVEDKEAIRAHQEGLDLHTITCCNIFGYRLPSNLQNPHTSTEDAEWRNRYNWQGKDTRVRVLAKNFSHGSKFTDTWRFVYKIKGIEQYGINYTDLGKLAKRYIESKGAVWKRKIEIMQAIRYDKLARSLYGFKRQFYDSSAETGREGFSHMISSTVSGYNNRTLIMLEEEYGDNQRCIHNAHDGDKICWKRDFVHSIGIDAFKQQLKQIIERSIEYQGRSLTMTAGIKVYD